MMNRVKNLLSADNVNLNDWEQGFLDSILSQLKRKRPLSAKQVQMIQKMEDRKTHPRLSSVASVMG